MLSVTRSSTFCAARRCARPAAWLAAKDSGIHTRSSAPVLVTAPIAARELHSGQSFMANPLNGVLSAPGRKGLPRFMTSATLPTHLGAVKATDSDDTAAKEGSWFTELKEGRWPKSLAKSTIVAPDDFNRWLAVPGSFLVQISIGSVYAWSMWNGPLTREMGVVAQASSDWSLESVVPVFSASAVCLGFTTFFLGPWAEKAGPRMTATAAAICYGSGCAVAGVGVMTHSLPLVYLGYGVLGGMGWGFGYISPVSTLIRWFPDRRGLATGLALTAFGGGAMLAAPAITAMCEFYAVAPTYLGPLADLGANGYNLVSENGVQYVTETAAELQLEVGGAAVAGGGVECAQEEGAVLKEIVVATASDINQAFSAEQVDAMGLAEGAYLAGTGSTGAGQAFRTLGGVYGSLMVAGAMMQRVPSETYCPKGWTPPAESAAERSIAHVHYADAVRTPQFMLLWTAVMGNAVAGQCIFASAKTMMGDIFGAAMPAVVTTALCTSYVAMLSGANAGGRLGWATASDITGRKNMYKMFGLGIPVALALPSITSATAADPNAMQVYVFMGGTMMMVSFYGGLFSVLPAYLADVFGSRHVGAIHGKVLTAWTVAGVVGPNLLTHLRETSRMEALTDLTSRADPLKFQQAFGAPAGELQSLAEAKTVSISRLMEIVPAGTPDPTPALYDSSMFMIAGMLSIAFAANLAMTPVDAKYHMQGENSGPVSAKKTVYVLA